MVGVNQALWSSVIPFGFVSKQPISFVVLMTNNESFQGASEIHNTLIVYQ